LSDFDINGLLKMHPMHLLSTVQWRSLLGEVPSGALLDIGAGNGDVTRPLGALFEEVCTTELSVMMAWRLRQRGYQCFRGDVSVDGLPGNNYAAISCLNVLDRCRRPRSLLERLSSGLASGGVLVVSVPLPYDPFYYDGGLTKDPEERLDCPSACWEESFAALVSSNLEPLGLSVRSWTRAPYLSVGGQHQELSSLDDAVVVLGRVMFSG